MKKERLIKLLTSAVLISSLASGCAKDEIVESTLGVDLEDLTTTELANKQAEVTKEDRFLSLIKTSAGFRKDSNLYDGIFDKFILLNYINYSSIEFNNPDDLTTKFSISENDATVTVEAKKNEIFLTYKNSTVNRTYHYKYEFDGINVVELINEETNDYTRTFIAQRDIRNESINDYEHIQVSMNDSVIAYTKMNEKGEFDEKIKTINIISVDNTVKETSAEQDYIINATVLDKEIIELKYLSGISKVK